MLAQLIDFMIDSHPASAALKAECASAGTSVFEALHVQLDAQRRAAGVAHDSFLTTHLHLYPDLHGNRSPLADPGMRGLLDGLALDASVHDLARVYYATLEAIALQTRQIIAALRHEGHRIDALYMSGGHTRNLVFMQLLADVCGVPVQLPASSSTSVVLGAAMLGRFAHETSDGAALETQAAAEAHAHKHADRLWQTMVCGAARRAACRPLLTRTGAGRHEQAGHICVSVQRRRAAAPARRQVFRALGKLVGGAPWLTTLRRRSSSTPSPRSGAGAPRWTLRRARREARRAAAARRRDGGLIDAVLPAPHHTTAPCLLRCPAAAAPRRLLAALRRAVTLRERRASSSCGGV